MRSLHKVVLCHHHVIAKVIEAELVVCPVGNIACVFAATLEGIHRVLDTADGESEILVDLPHPCAIAFGEIVVYRHHMHPAPRKRIQIHRHGCNECLPLAGRHLCNLALVKDGTADQLCIKRDHIPDHLVAHEVKGLTDEPATCILDSGKGLR